MTKIHPADADKVLAAGHALADVIRYGDIVSFDSAFQWHYSWLGVMRAAGVDPVDPNGEDGPATVPSEKAWPARYETNRLAIFRWLRWAAVVYGVVGFAVVLARLAW